MMTLNRRKLLFGVVTALALAANQMPAWAVDLDKLNEPSEAGEMVLGSPQAKVTIIEYASASCPHCAKFHKETFPLLKRDYIDTGKVRLVFREFPHNPQAVAAFMIARCAPREKYFALIEAIFATQEAWLKAPKDGLFKVARFAGFSREAFEACLTNRVIAREIVAVQKKAKTEFGVRGVPAFFINGKLIRGTVSLDKMKSIIDPLLQEPTTDLLQTSRPQPLQTPRPQ
jgi:protein-disulfide isomerase